MKELEQKILTEGKVLAGGVLKVDAFLNHQVDVKFASEMAKEWKKAFCDENVNKILTIESSGIALATPVALEFEVPLVFAKNTFPPTLHPRICTKRPYILLLTATPTTW